MTVNEIVNSAAILIKQADASEDEKVKTELRGAAKTLLETVNLQLTPGATPAPAPEPEEEDD